MLLLASSSCRRSAWILLLIRNPYYYHYTNGVIVQAQAASFVSTSLRGAFPKPQRFWGDGHCCSLTTSTTIMAARSSHSSFHNNNDRKNAATGKGQKHQRQSPRKPYRPGMNSYLKVLLDDDTVQKLHQATLEMQEKAARAANIKIKSQL